MKKIAKRIVFMMLAVLCAASAFALPQAASASGNIRVFIEGELITPRDANGRVVHPQLVGGNTFLPIRAVGEAFGKDVSWDSATQSVIIGRRPSNLPARGSNIRVFIDGTQLIARDANGNIVNPFQQDGTTFLPLRAIGEAFDKTVHWDSRNQSVFIGRGTFTITVGGRSHIATMADVLALNPRAFTASPRGETRNFTGVPLASILTRLNINTGTASMAVVTSEDGFSSSLTIAEVRDTSNVFIAITENGRPLGTPDTDGRGPFMLVIAQDPFANRFARYVVDVTLS